MPKSYLNAIWEFQNFNECFEWLVKLDKENDKLKDENARLLDQRTVDKNAYARALEIFERPIHGISDCK